MAERYLFNKSLNRRSSRWPWLLGFAAICTVLMVYVAPAKALEPVLYDPNDDTPSTRITGIDFTREANNIGVTLVTFEGASPTPQLVESQGKVTITLANSVLDDSQLVELNVTEFSTPVSTIETFQDKKGTRIEILYSDTVTARHAIDDNIIRIKIEPMSLSQQEELENKKTYTGDPISLDFQDVPVRQVLQIIAQVNGFNLVTTDTVTGNVTISLSGVPWDQALDMILRVKGLDKRLEGNILLIAPTEELTARETQALQSKKQVSDLAPLSTVNISVNYAKAANLATILKSSEGGILSERGTVTVDERTNTMLIRDTLPSIDEARKMIDALDIPVKQVLIESRMVTVLDNVDEELGVRWGLSDRESDSGVSGSIEGAEAIAGGSIPSIDDRLNVNLPVSGATGTIGFQIASLVDGTILDLELSALESENKGEIIASPRITVANQQEAYIEQGTEIPYVQATSSGATSVEFKKAVLSLRVTPQITPDNRIILDLVVTQDTRGETVSTSTGDAVAIDTQEIKTQVLVENGETIVLGGIFQQTSTDNVSKVPLFGDLPFLGVLFRNTSEFQEKRELLIFVTPKIITEKP
ncbi:type IV pilus secretin PilQ [Alteromonas stellipolaris]|jgi:type IV pilus assembly protein PilQ|uniref:Secretin n=1 Tax=Alteromonas stellipolaris TaxID=233316 RepID=A0ABN4LH21_9ALTE|nr:type IV pilus secretin PilQ family protein [Alteromonas stellipolaris]ALM92100.1 Type IV pilus biogenesis protein PilQ [Alteromonas stellipolaris LMG 21856]AMJ73084.1 secretin [Alteromonas stellipolaris]MBZ2160447.1 type IV pilus secretin PilQ family protein [Alteromonas stellipolaris]MDP2536809.1 type IV pilus secretin PilQ family protein [Alteromonas stellipolaris]MDP2597496.1 type IV pilus secretin PilQ family protein [Alteromonas stellipolaris]